MDMIAYRRFGGEVPVSPPHLLPEFAAQQAINCDFNHGHLRPLKQGFLLTTLAAAVRTIYTEDGINFYTWDVETSVAKSPVKQDTFERIYYLDAGVLRATTTAGLSPAGGPPALSFKVGVPAPTVAPALATVERTDLRDYPDATVGVVVWWEFDAERYQETTPALTQVTALREYTFSAPARDTVNTPEGAVVRATFNFFDNAGKPFMTVGLTAGEVDIHSTALPGGITFALTSTGGTAHKIVLTWGIVETRAYTATTFNTWKEESGPGPAAQVSTTYIQDVQVTLTAVDFTGYQALSAYRTYRTIGASPAYLRVHEAVDLDFTDTSYKAADIKGTLDTLDYTAPPALLDVFVRLPNGCFAGFKGNTLYVSEAYRPHTWQYQLPFAKNIRGILAAPQSLVVTTAEGCFIVVGSSPASLQPLQLPAPQAGIAQRSMVSLDGRVVFASHDGIVTVAGSQAGMADSQRLFARDDWQGRYGDILADASMRFATQDGCLIATSSTQPLGFLLRTDEMAAGQLTQFNVQMDAMFQLPVADALYYSVGASIYEFNADASYAYTWWGRDWIWNRPRNLGAGYIRCSGPVTITLYADGALWWTDTVTSGYFRLPSGRSALRWSVKLQGTATVEELYISRSMMELQSV